MEVEKNTAGKKKSKKQGRLLARKEHAEPKHSHLRHSVSTARVWGGLIENNCISKISPFSLAYIGENNSG